MIEDRAEILAVRNEKRKSKPKKVKKLALKSDVPKIPSDSKVIQPKGNLEEMLDPAKNNLTTCVAATPRGVHYVNACSAFDKALITKTDNVVADV